MIFKILKFVLTPFRFVMGGLILSYDRLFQPKALKRESGRQAQVDQETTGLVLYHFEACPFCVKVRRHIQGLGLKIEMHDVRKDKTAKQELLQGGGQFQVPCLRITGEATANRWMYESSDINEYLSQRFSS